MFEKVTHLSLFVHDQDEALDFYEKLGFKVHTDTVMPDGFRWLTICAPAQKDFEIALMPATTEEQKDLIGLQAADTPLFCLSTKNLDKLYQEWRRHSVEIIEEPKQMPWGKQAIFADLYGNIINVVE